MSEEFDSNVCRTKPSSQSNLNPQKSMRESKLIYNLISSFFSQIDDFHCRRSIERKHLRNEIYQLAAERKSTIRVLHHEPMMTGWSLRLDFWFYTHRIKREKIMMFGVVSWTNKAGEPLAVQVPEVDLRSSTPIDATPTVASTLVSFSS